MLDPLSSVLSASVRAQSKSPVFLGSAQLAKPVAATPDDFSSMLTQMIGQTTEALGKAETTSAAAIQGKASLQEVVESVMAADQSLQTAIAVRDKITGAYLELSRMAI